VFTVYASSSQLKHEISNPINEGEAEASVESGINTDTSSIDELKRAFEFIEVSSPGITDQLLSRIAAYLQHRYSKRLCDQV
jgi:hypothetical protein